jgi:hypothetical protein
MGRAVNAGKVVTISVAAERWEPYEARVSRTVLRGPGGEIPPGYSLCVLNRRWARKESTATLDALSKMGAGPPEPAYRRRLQTATSCWGKEPWW